MKSEFNSNAFSEALLLVGALKEHLSQTDCEHCKNIVKKAFRSQNDTSKNTVLGEL
jgi:hypothetical protein